MERHIYEGPPCPKCGVKHPFDNVFCDDPFHMLPEARPTADLDVRTAATRALGYLEEGCVNAALDELRAALLPPAHRGLA